MFSPETLNMLYRYGYSLTGNEADAYDLLQDALARYLERGSEQDNPVAYLRRMMRNQFIDQLRREQRFPLEALNTIDPKMSEDDAMQLERIVISQQTLQQVWAQLMPMERELLHLWALDGFNAREIAEQLDVPRGTILSRIHRLRKKIGPLADSAGLQADTGHPS